MKLSDNIKLNMALPLFSGMNQKSKESHSSKNSREAQEKHWRTAQELPPHVFAVWQKPNRALNPVAIVATVDPDGIPRTAPFGSLRAIAPKLLRLICYRHHTTYTNFQNGCVSVALVAPPDCAVSVCGRARIVREYMKTDERYAVVDIDIEEVKNDMVRIVSIESAITISPREEYRTWFSESLGEAESM